MCGHYRIDSPRDVDAAPPPCRHDVDDDDDWPPLGVDIMPGDASSLPRATSARATDDDDDASPLTPGDHESSVLMPESLLA